MSEYFSSTIDPPKEVPQRLQQYISKNGFHVPWWIRPMELDDLCCILSGFIPLPARKFCKVLLNYCKKHIDVQELVGLIGDKKFEHLEANRFGDQQVNMLGYYLSINKTLERFQLTSNGIDIRASEWLGEGLRQNSTLTDLDLKIKYLSAPAVKNIVNALESNSTLTLLSLFGNDINIIYKQEINDIWKKNMMPNQLPINWKVNRQTFCEKQKIIVQMNKKHNMDDAVIIAFFLKENQDLTNLNLNKNMISDAGVKALLTALTPNTNLKKLYLAENGIGDVGAQAIGEALRINSSIIDLQLDGNIINVTGAQDMSNGLETNSTLTLLSLRNNNVGIAGKQAIDDAWKKNTSLDRLSVNWNVLLEDYRTPKAEIKHSNKGYTNEDINIIASFLKKNIYYKKLNLKANEISHDGVTYLTDGLKINSTLKELNLGHNRIGDAGAQTIGEFLKANPTLAILKLNENTISEIGVKNFGESLKVNSALKELTLSGNSIGDMGTAAIMDGLKENSILKKLGLAKNKIANAGAQAIGEGFETHDNGDVVFKRITKDKSEEAIKIGDYVYASKKVDIGSKIFAQWKSGINVKKYPAQIQAINDNGSYSVIFDDGDIRETCPYDELELGKKEYGKIENINTDATYKVRFENGDIRQSCPEQEMDGVRYKRGRIESVVNSGSYTISFSDGSQQNCKVNKTLNILQLNNNQIGDAGAQAIAKCLIHSTSLKDVWLHSNKFGDESCDAFVKALATNKKQPKKMYLYSNKFSWVAKKKMKIASRSVKNRVLEL